MGVRLVYRSSQAGLERFVEFANNHRESTFTEILAYAVDKGWLTIEPVTEARETISQIMPDPEDSRFDARGAAARAAASQGLPGVGR